MRAQLFGNYGVRAATCGATTVVLCPLIIISVHARNCNSRACSIRSTACTACSRSYHLCARRTPAATFISANTLCMHACLVTRVHNQREPVSGARFVGAPSTLPAHQLIPSVGQHKLPINTNGSTHDNRADRHAGSGRQHKCECVRVCRTGLSLTRRWCSSAHTGPGWTHSNAIMTFIMSGALWRRRSSAAPHISVRVSQRRTFDVCALHVVHVYACFHVWRRCLHVIRLREFENKRAQCLRLAL